MYNNPDIISTSGGLGVDVAVLDTGVYKGHLDLSRRIDSAKFYRKSCVVKDGSCDDKTATAPMWRVLF